MFDEIVVKPRASLKTDRVRVWMTPASRAGPKADLGTF
jgi:hypothetical protein